MPETSSTITIACQQVLQNDGSVYSVQWLDLPASYAKQVSAPRMMERYFDFVRRFTLSMIRPALGPEGVQFRLLGTSLTLLSFSLPRYLKDDSGDQVQLAITGGFMVQAQCRAGGSFTFSTARAGDGVRMKVQLSEFCPMLLGSSAPSLMRKLLYRFTQAWVHKLVTVRFFSRLYRDLTGSKGSVRVQEVKVREGKPI